MVKLKANEVLELMREILIGYLEQLKGYKDVPEEQFQYGEKVAYIECLEYIQMWIKADEKGLNFDIAKRYQL